MSPRSTGRVRLLRSPASALSTPFNRAGSPIYLDPDGLLGGVHPDGDTPMYDVEKSQRTPPPSCAQGPARFCGPDLLYAGHDQPLGGASPLWRLMAPTTSRGQLRRREAGWEGSRRRNRDLRYANRIGGGAARASQQRVAKPDAIKRPSRKCGGCARKVAGLIPGDLRGCP